METRQATVTSTHVLAVDDDPSVRQMIADYLADNEVRVTAVASGRAIADVMGLLQLGVCSACEIDEHCMAPQVCEPPQVDRMAGLIAGTCA